MALDPSKWSFTSGRAIRYLGGAHGTATANYVTVLELYRWLMDLADDAAAAGDDLMDITKLTPGDKKFDTIIQLLNLAYLDDGYTTPASEYIYNGSIIQDSGTGETIYDGINIVANRGVIVNAIQNNVVLANKFWNNTPYGESFAGINPDPANGYAMRFVVKVKDAGTVIDNGALIFTTREWGKTFSEFRKPSTGRGTNDIPLTYANDLNNATVIGDIASAPFTGVSNTTAGFKLIDVDNNTVNEEYYSEWNRGSCTINQFYEKIKHLTRNGETATLYGIPGERFRGITHMVDIGTPSGGTFAQGGATPLSWTGGTGQILANDTTAHKLYIQLLTGTAPGTGVVVTQGAVSAATSADAAEKPVSTPMCGASTGSSLVGAYGFSLEYADLAVNDKITAFDGTTRQPPNNVQFTVGGIQSGWRILVGPENGSGALNPAQLTLNGALSGAAVTSVVVNEVLTGKNIPASTTASGGVAKIRILRANGVYSSHAYTAVNTGTKTFTIAATDFSTNNASNGANAFVAYIDEVASTTSITFNTIQTVGQTLFVEARYGGTGPSYATSIKPAKTTGSLGSTGGSATVSSVSDA